MSSLTPKEMLDLLISVITLLGFLGALLGWLYTRHDTKKKGETAMAQIDLLTTNHFPHMTMALEEIKGDTKETNKILTELRLGQVETNTLLKAKIM